jgi:hypothetical protein
VRAGLGAIIALAATTGAAAAQDARIDYPKMIIRVPAAGGLPPALSIAPTAYLPTDALENAQRREGQIRGRIFDAVAKAYQALPPEGAAGLDIKLLEERIAAEVADIAGGGPVRIVFREFSLR